MKSYCVIEVAPTWRFKKLVTVKVCAVSTRYSPGPSFYFYKPPSARAEKEGDAA